MSSFMENIQKRRFIPPMPLKDDIPISQTEASTDSHLIVGIRRRISSFSVKMQPLSSVASSAWAFRRSKSVPSISDLGGAPLKRWWSWGWGWGWILSRKPTFSRDLEMNEEEKTTMLGSQSKMGSWRHVFHRVRFQIRKLVGPTSTLPTTQRFRYDSFSYAQNFDNGKNGHD